MAQFKQRATKLPILLALPVLVALGLGGLFLLWPNEPDPPKPGQIPGVNEPELDPPASASTDPLTVGPDTTHQPVSRPGVPDSVATADAMLAEAFGAMRDIRARLELKFKYADYQLDRSWTIAGVLRHPEKLDGKYFTAADYTLSYPDPDQPIALIECPTVKGRELADGKLSMRLNVQTGECEEAGIIYARNATGEILLADDLCRYLGDALQTAAVNHMLAQLSVADGELASTEDYFKAVREPFKRGDYSVSTQGQRVTFACRSLGGEPIADPAYIAVDYAKRQINISRQPGRVWLPLPKSRDEFEESYRWYLHWVCQRAAELVKQEGHARSVQLTEIQLPGWYFTNTGTCPWDLKLTISEKDPLVVTLEIGTSWGRSLPFKPVRLIAQPDKDRYEFKHD